MHFEGGRRRLHFPAYRQLVLSLRPPKLLPAVVQVQAQRLEPAQRAVSQVQVRVRSLVQGQLAVLGRQVAVRV